MAHWVAVARTDDLLPGEARIVEQAGRSLAVYNVDGAFLVTDNTCLHRGGPLGDGFLVGRVITCPWHGWQYDVGSGQKQGNPGLRVKTYPVLVKDGEVKIRI